MSSHDTAPSGEIHDEAIDEAPDVEKGKDEYPQPENIITRVLSRRSGQSLLDPGPPPDGGLKAWTQVLLAHLAVFTTWGYITSFGVFQTYYVSTLHRSPSDISWVGSMQIFLIFFVGTFSGRALDAGLFKHVFCLGLLFQLLGVFMTSISKSYWQLFLAQGVCTGLGDGLLFCPVVALVSTYFSKRRVLALSSAAAGTATGGVVFPLVVQQLLPKIGFGWTIRVLGLIMLVIGIIAAIGLQPRLPPRKSGPLVEWSAFKEPIYVLYCAGNFFCFWALFFAFFYVGAFGRNFEGFSYSDSITLLVITNSLGVPGRIIPALLADYLLGPLNMLIPIAFSTALLMYCWAAVESKGGTYAFAVTYGFISSGIISLWPAGLTSLTKDPQKAGTRLGMGFTIVSLATLTGSPLGGALLQEHDGRYLYAQMWGGSSLLFGALILVAARISKTGFTLMERV